MKIFYDSRWTRTDYHDGISRYGAGIVQGFIDNKIPITVLIKDKRQLKLLPEGVPYLLVNDPLSFKEFFIAKKLNRLGAERGGGSIPELKCHSPQAVASTRLRTHDLPVLSVRRASELDEVRA